MASRGHRPSSSCRPDPIGGIDGKAVTAHTGAGEERHETERFGIGGVDDVPNVDIERAGVDSQFVDEGDIHMVEGVRGSPMLRGSSTERAGGWPRRCRRHREHRPAAALEPRSRPRRAVRWWALAEGRKRPDESASATSSSLMSSMLDRPDDRVEILSLSGPQPMSASYCRSTTFDCHRRTTRVCCRPTPHRWPLSRSSQ